MKQQGQGAGTANNGGKWQGWGEQHKTNHIATHYRAEREELGNRDRELEKREQDSKKHSNAYRRKGGGF